MNAGEHKCCIEALDVRLESEFDYRIAPSFGSFKMEVPFESLELIQVVSVGVLRSHLLLSHPITHLRVQSMTSGCRPTGVCSISLTAVYRSFIVRRAFFDSAISCHAVSIILSAFSVMPRLITL